MRFYLPASMTSVDEHQTISVNGQSFEVTSSAKGAYISAPATFMPHLRHLGYVGVADPDEGRAAPEAANEHAEDEGRDRPLDQMNYAEQRAYLKGQGVNVVGVKNKDLLEVARLYSAKGAVVAKQDEDPDSTGEADEVTEAPNLKSMSPGQLRLFLTEKGVSTDGVKNKDLLELAEMAAKEG